MIEVLEQRARASRDYADSTGTLLEDLAVSCIDMIENLSNGQEAILRIYALADLAKIAREKHLVHLRVMVDESHPSVTDDQWTGDRDEAC